MNSLLRRLLALLTMAWFPHLLWSQSTSDVISGIRERYYNVTNELNQLNVIRIEGFDFYLKNAAVSIVKTKYEGGQLEFYYIPDAEEGYILYFIFFNRDDGSSDPDIRVYLNDEENVVLTKLNQVEADYLENRKTINKLLLESKNALNTFFNLFEIAKNHKASTISQILNDANDVNKRIEKTDTVEYFKGEDGGYYEQGEFKYYDTENQLIKTLSYHAGEHGSGWNTTYFVEGKRICSIDEGVAWAPYFNLTVTIIYYKRGIHEIRRDFYNSQGVEVSIIENKEELFRYDLKDIVPQIEYD